MPSAAVFQALYTPNLTQKRKKWYDGQCKFFFKSNKMRLTDEDGRLLEEQFWSSRNNTTSMQMPTPGASIKFERFIVELDSLMRTVEYEPTERIPIDAQSTKPHLPKKAASGHTCIPRIPRREDQTPLDEVLKNNPIRATNPISKIPLNTESPKSIDNSTKKRRKYVPWGDQFAPIPPENQTIGTEKKKTLERRPEEEKHEETKVAEEEQNLFVRSPFSDFDFEFENEDEPSNIILPDYFSLDSDLESEGELEILDETRVETPRKSIFDNIPTTAPDEGPWTKEAYMLFSWHPPKPDKLVSVKSIDGDPRLTVDGDLQAQELATHISDAANINGDKITAIYSSPFYRCLQTATPSSEKLSVPIWVETGIGEYYTATRPTKPVPWPASRSKPVFANIDLSYNARISVDPNGETRETLNDRVLRALDAIIAHADSKGHSTILIVTHAAVKIVINELLCGETARAGTCSLDKLVRSISGPKPFKLIQAGDTSFLSGGEQMHWSFDMAYEAGSAADEASRKQDATEKEIDNSLVSLDVSGLPESEQPDSLDPSKMVFTKMETDRPLIQIGSKIYEGEWQRIVGTEVYTSNSGKPLGTAKYRIKLHPADVDIPQNNRKPLLERIAEVKQ